LKDTAPKTRKKRPQHPAGGEFPEKAANGKAGKIAQPQVTFADPEA